MGMTGLPGPEVEIRSIGAGGVGVGNLPDGRIVFVPRTAPGDRARIALTREKERFATGRLQEILEVGPHRRTPPCPLFHRCGGCALQHLEYARQLHWKGRIAGDALRRIGGMDVEDPRVEGSPREFQYRNKMSFSLRRVAGNRVVAGFHELENPGRILDVHGECLLPVKPLLSLWTGLRAAWGPGASLLPGGKELRLTLRAEGGEEGALVLGGGKGDGGLPPRTFDPFLTRLSASFCIDNSFWLFRVPGLTSIWRHEGRRGARHLAGSRSLHMAWLDENLEVAGDAFVQVNQEAGQALHHFILDQARALDPSTVVEAYCGAGVLGKTLAREGRTVAGIELDPHSVAEARRDSPQTFRVLEGRVEECLKHALPADLVLLNPPRQGLAREVPERIREMRPRGILYVSCDPATLARDLKRLGGSYGVESLRAFDLFPQTGHVETVAVLARSEG